jgi:hypothetical protein
MPQIIVNELSGRIDLDSTLVRAEALFRRFKRMVDTIDKKASFPAPRRSILAPPVVALPQPAGASPNSISAIAAAEVERSQRMVTPELRALLSRKVVELPRAEVAKRAAAGASRSGASEAAA